MRSHLAVVVGAGPAGLSAAAELHDALLVDLGRGVEERDRDSPVDVLSGIGGAGLFSDGKHSFFPSASGLWRLPGVRPAFERTAELLSRHGVTPPSFPDGADGGQGREAMERAGSADWLEKPYPSFYVPLRERMLCIAELSSSVREVWKNAEVVGARREGERIVLSVAGREEVSTRRLIVATGRLSPRWIRPWLEPLGVKFGFRRLEFGVRLEVAAGSVLFRRLRGVDAKLRLAEPATGLEFRTFCTCRDGEVVTGTTHGIRAVSGRADGPPTGRSNVGLLVRTFDEKFARSVERHVFSDGSFGPEGDAAVQRALEALCAWCPGLREEAPKLHGPCIEGVGDYPLEDGRLCAAPGVWLAGDVCGRFRGIVASMVSGRYAAAASTSR